MPLMNGSPTWTCQLLLLALKWRRHSRIGWSAYRVGSDLCRGLSLVCRGLSRSVELSSCRGLSRSVEVCRVAVELSCRVTVELLSSFLLCVELTVLSRAGPRAQDFSSLRFQFPHPRRSSQPKNLDYAGRNPHSRPSPHDDLVSRRV